MMIIIMIIMIIFIDHHHHNHHCDHVIEVVVDFDVKAWPIDDLWL